MENVDDIYPLTPMQSGMLYHSVADPGSGAFVNQIVARLGGELHPDRLRASWQALTGRHASLRTAFLWDGLDSPLQVVRTHVAPVWTELDWRGLPAEVVDERREALLARERRSGFDLAAAPLLRHTLIRCGPTEWQWIWTYHHLILDGWSARLLIDETLAAHEGPLPAAPAPMPFRDFVAWLGERDGARDERFWREQLAGLSPVRLEVPGARPAADASGYRCHVVELDAPTSGRLRTRAAARRVTLNTAVLGAWLVLLGRWTRRRDVIVGVTSAGRPAALAGVDRAVGLFINTQPLRVDVDPSARLDEWLRGVQTRQLARNDVEHAALVDVQRWAGLADGEALFESLFVFENLPAMPARATGPQLEGLAFIEHSNYPLAILVEPGEPLTLQLVYDTTRFGERAVASLGAQLCALLEQLAADGEPRLEALESTGASTRQGLLAWGRGPTPLPGPAGDAATVSVLFSRTAHARPDATAVVSAGRTTTYAELAAAVSELAARLRATGVGPNVPVGLLMPRSVEMVIGIFAILEAGGAYVPLSTDDPPAFGRDVLASAGITVALTDDPARAALHDVATVVSFGAGPPDVAGPPPTAIETGGEPLAYLIHTSGSTGRPRAVMVSQRSLVASTRARLQRYPEPVERFLLLPSVAFDSSVAGIFWTLCSGGALVLPGPGLERDAAGLRRLIASASVTHLLALPVLYELLISEAGPSADLASLRVAIVAGEACPPSVVAAHRDRVPSAALYNEYGPTEATVWATVARLDDAPAGDDGPISIGRPIPGTHVRLLDAQRRWVAPGFAGELFLAGEGLALGYHGHPELTAERFVTVDVGAGPERMFRTGDLAFARPDGALCFLGREDRQLKIRGHRVEAEAVEAALRQLPGVADAAVAGRSRQGDAPQQLVAYVVGRNGAAIDGAAVSEGLRERLPAYMVPGVVLALDGLPRLPNGKTDRAALPDPFAAADAPLERHAPPRNPTEEALVQIWCDLLGLDQVGIHDDYFALGGDSITSIRMVSRARQAGVSIDPAQIASSPTIAGLAACHAAAQPAPIPAATRRGGDVPLGPIQRWLIESDLAAPQHWNQSTLCELAADTDADALDRALRGCVAHHDMLRARFERGNDGWRQRIEPPRDERLLEIVELPPGGSARNAIAAAQGGLDLAAGPLLRAVLLRSTDATIRLLLAVHHLVVDAVSWGILLDDLETAYAQAARGAAPRLPPQTTGYHEWVERLSTRDASGEVAYWAGAAAGSTLPVDHPGDGPGLEGDAARVQVGLDAERTQALLTRANESYHTRAHDLLVTALARTLLRWTGGDVLRLALEGHGRPEREPGIDVTRAVGWFTAMYPVSLHLDHGLPPGTALKSVKEQLRAVPDSGVGYGVLRYLQRDPAVAQVPQPDVLFNFLGRAAGAVGGRLIDRATDALDSARAPANARGHLLEVAAAVRGGRLAFDWHYTRTRHEERTVRQLAEATLDELERLIDHCLDPSSGGFTPSDFPEAGLGQAELDDFLDGLEP